MRLSETLHNIKTLREEAIRQQQSYEKGEQDKPPAIKPETFDLMEK